MSSRDELEKIDPELAAPPRAPALDARVLAAVGKVEPVRPLPPPIARAAGVVIVGMCIVLAYASPVSEARIPAVAALLLIAVSGTWLSMRLSIPGAVAPFPLAAAVVALPPVFAVAALAVYGRDGAVVGLECLRIGTIVSLLPFVVGAILVARGWPVTPSLAGAVAGVSAGGFGLALLSLNCPVAEGPHIAVFHGGVVALTLVTGALAALAAARFRRL